MRHYNEQALNAEERAVMRWQYDILGGFESTLWDAITRADGHNLEALGKGFPDEVNGYKKFTSVSGWWHEVLERAFNSKEV